MEDTKPTAPGTTTDARSQIEPGNVIDHYQVLRSVGRGSMGEVFLARDLRLGRRVALKVVRSHSLADEQARGRFLREARVTAQFAHPHIVTIHDVGEWRERPYLALEYLEGQTLRDRLEDERLGTRETVRIARDVASALAEAHAHQVLHRDLKPENVLLPRDGRPRVLDFGLAKPVVMTSDDATAPAEDPDSPWPLSAVAPLPGNTQGLHGTPGYMAPEQWKERMVSPAADLWALGVVMHEMLTGRRPYEGAAFYELAALTASPEPVPSLEPREPEIPAPLVDLVNRCLDKDPEARPAAAAALRTLDRLLDGAPRRDAQDCSPFRGLLPFSERHAELFFGRDDEISAFIELMREETVLPVLGPSGAGKSSFVQAGVVPRLRDGARWQIIRIRPGRTPFSDLAFRLLAPPTSTRSPADPLLNASTSSRSLRAIDESILREEQRLATALRETPTRLALELARLAETNESRVLLFVDQLEELYTLVEDPECRRAFMQALCLAADDPTGPVRVIFTVRDDFLWRIAEGAEVRRVLSRFTVLRPPGAEALREILERPVEAVGYRWDDPALPREMVAEVAQEASALPLLQFTCQQLWVHRDAERRTLTRAAYDEVGGVAGSLANHADGTLAALSAAQEHTARQIFLRLVNTDGTRQRVAKSDLTDGLPEDAHTVLERFTENRTILERKGRTEAELELVHESLISHWDRLAQWLDESREERLFLAQVGQAADLWEARGSRVEEVWQGDALAEAVRRAALSDAVPSPARRFLQAGQRRANRRQRVRKLALTATVLILALIAAGATLLGLAFRKKEQEAQRHRRVAVQRGRLAEQQKAVALQKRAEALRESARAAWARGALLETRAKLRTALEHGDSAEARALWWQLTRQPLQWRRSLGATLYQVAFHPQGRRLAVASMDHAVHLFDLDTGAEQVLRGHRDQVLSLAFGPVGRTLASGTLNGEVRLWDLRTGLARVLSGHKGGLRSLSFHPHGRWLASAGDDRTIRVWDTKTAALRRTLAGHTATVHSVAFGPKGRWLASGGGDDRVILWDGASLQRGRTLKTRHRSVLSLAFTDHGRSLATGGADHGIRLWRVSDGHLLRELTGHTGNVLGLAVDPQGQRIASASHDRTTRIWRLGDGRLLRTLAGHKAQVRAVAWHPTRARLATASWDHSVALWALPSTPVVPHHSGHRGTVNGVAFHPEGKVLVTGGVDKTLRLWDAATGAVRRVLRGHAGAVWGVAWHPRKSLIASASSDRTVRLWNPDTGRTVRILRGHRAEVWTVAFSPDGKRLATGSSDHTGRLWDVATGRPGPVLRGHRGAVWNVRFDAQGRTLVSASHDGALRIWDAATGTLRRTLTGHTGDAYDAHLTPDGARLLSAGNDHTLRVWPLGAAPNAKARVTRLPGRSYSLDPSRDYHRVAVAVTDGTVRLWEPASGKLTVLGRHRGEVNVVRFGPKGRRVASTGDDGTVRLWDIQRQRARWRAPLLDARGPTLHYHGGRASLASAGEKPRDPLPDTLHLPLERARCADRSRGGQLLCLRTREGVELWNARKPVRRVLEPFPGAGRVLALQGACAARSGPQVRLIRIDGRKTTLSRTAVAMARDGDGLLLATADEVLAFTPKGRVRGRGSVGPGVTALTRVGPWIAVGYRDGGLELRRFASGAQSEGISFEDTPASAVVRLAAGPAGTLVAGFANGVYGLWSVDRGHRLHRGRLHGAARHVALSGGRLLVASSLGQHAAVDLRVFHRPYCELLRAVWAVVPTVWEHGRPKRRAPPTAHRCQNKAHPAGR